MGDNEKAMSQQEFDNRMRHYEQHVARESTTLQAMTAYTNTAINSIILCNSAAAGAVLALIGTIWGQAGAKEIVPTATFAVGLYAAGAACGMFAAAGGYLCQSFVQGADIARYHRRSLAEKRWDSRAAVTEGISVFIALLGAGLFLFGTWYGLDALNSADPEVAKADHFNTPPSTQSPTP